jgi:hypothetical protein
MCFAKWGKSDNFLLNGVIIVAYDKIRGKNGIYSKILSHFLKHELYALFKKFKSGNMVDQFM